MTTIADPPATACAGGGTTSPIAGQRGALHVVLAPRAGRTRAAACFATAPLGTVSVADVDGSGFAELQITNPGGGVLGGDRLEVAIELARGARATVLTQGATRVYRGPEAHQRTLLEVGPGAVLEYLPHHVIPFAGSSYRQQTIARVDASATLVAWEAFAAGRVAAGERFAFERLSSRTRILRGGNPLATDGLELASGGEPLAGRSYIGTLQVVAPIGLDGLADTLAAVLDRVPGVLASASAPTAGLCTARVLGARAPALHAALRACREAARSFLELPVAEAR